MLAMSYYALLQWRGAAESKRLTLLLSRLKPMDEWKNKGNGGMGGGEDFNTKIVIC